MIPKVVSTLYYGPIIFQAVFGADSIGSGVRLVPYMSCLIVSSVSSGIMLNRFPYVKFYIVIGSMCNIIGFGLFYTVNEYSNWAQQACYIMLCGMLDPTRCFIQSDTHVVYSHMSSA